MNNHQFPEKGMHCIDCNAKKLEMDNNFRIGTEFDYVDFQTYSDIPCTLYISIDLEGFRGKGSICISYLRDEVIDKIEKLKTGKVKSVFIKDQDSVDYHLKISPSIDEKEKYILSGIIGDFVDLSLRFSVTITFDELSSLQKMIANIKI